MGWYYNKGRGNLPLTLAGTNSISMTGNSWIELKGADETTASVMRAKKKGLLHRQDAAPKHLRPAVPPKEEKDEAKAEAAPEKTPPAKAATPKPEAKKEEVKTPGSGDEAGAPAAPKPKPSAAGKKSKTRKTAK